MSMLFFIFINWVLVSLSYMVFLASSATWCLQDFVEQSNQQFEQKTDRFWEYSEETNTWIELKLPYDLVSCVNDNCTKVGSIDPTMESKETREYDGPEHKESQKKKEAAESFDMVLPIRKRVSLTKMSENSVWVTGVSGSVYERFWNGVQWVIAPHDLPAFAGPAISAFMFNQTILALTEAGILYQMQLSESLRPLWVEFTPELDKSMNKEGGQNPVIQIKSGVVTNDGERVYFCTKNGLLLELNHDQNSRWVNHGQPPGANVVAIADAGSIRPEVVYTISSTGDLYEYDRTSKPSWKKHIWSKGTVGNASLTPSAGFTVHGLMGDHSKSLFLLTKGGTLIERRIQQRKWKWIVHGSPKDNHLTSITPAIQDESNENSFSIFFTTSAGTIFEYRLLKQSGTSQELPEEWISHMHPPQAKIARGIPGLPLQAGRLLFPVDDGRLAELHLSGLGGETSGPASQLSIRRKAFMKYVWTILNAPETEGWNAEYCTEDRGPMNCIIGIKDEPNDSGTPRMTRRRKTSQVQHDYLFPSTLGGEPQNLAEEYNLPDNWINTNYRLRVMHGGRSFFFITDGGFTFEYLYAENVWLWLRHDHSTPMKGTLANYNGSLYVVDIYGSLFIRERSSNELGWINCTAMRRGRQVIGGPPWEGMTGKVKKVTAEDALFFVSKNGRLLQFTVALRKFKWKDCRHPPSTKVACIVDQEQFRENIVFIVGRNGRLYQYNKVTELWHEHYQSQHLTLSTMPGTAMRPSSMSLTGSLFMISDEGGLIEYNWNTFDGWNWVEHGTPDIHVTLVGSPGPCFGGNQLFLIGSDGKVYLRYMDQMIWRWKNCGFPYNHKMKDEITRQIEEGDTKEEICTDEDFATSSKKNADKFQDLNKNCNPKVISTRPIPFSEDSIIFELRDGRLAEMQRMEDTNWEWVRTISTPTSTCFASYWTALAS